MVMIMAIKEAMRKNIMIMKMIVKRKKKDVANYAKEKSVVVNIVTIEDTDCKLAVLRKVSDLSNGEMTVVNTHNLSKEFVNLINNKTIATSVQVYKLH
jgi:hypothetical protein